jgi:hypothetical protein
MKAFWQIIAGGLLLVAIPREAGSAAGGINLSPKLQQGQTFSYQIGYRAETRTKTESAVAAPMAPPGGLTDEHLQLQGEVEEVRPEGTGTLARLRTWILESDAAAATNASGSAANVSESAKPDKKKKEIELTLHANGQVSDLKGMDALTPEEQAAWQEWVARFGTAAIFPAKGVKPGDKWKAVEPIPSAVLTGLQWDKESEYVNDAPCHAMQLTPQGELTGSSREANKCAVILTTATLRQKSSPRDATPEDYKLHELRTMGTAKGKNEIITYISLKTGLVMRATEDSKQSMDVIVAKADGTNRVHYNIDAESHAEVLLVKTIAPSKNP